MALSSKERKAIALFDHATVRKVLRDYGWDGGAIDAYYEEFLNEDGIALYVPLDVAEFDGCDDEDLVIDFADAEDVSMGIAIALLSGKQATPFFEWHEPGTLPPVNVPLIVDIDGRHRAAEFTGDRLKFCNGMHVFLRGGNWSYAIDAIAWELPA